VLRPAALAVFLGADAAVDAAKLTNHHHPPRVALHRGQVQDAARVMPVAERIDRSAVFDMPDLTTMPTAATNDWMSAAHPGLVATRPGV